MTNDDERAFEIGPLSDAARKAAAEIRLALAYTAQDATQRALEELCKKASFDPHGARWTLCASSKEHFEDIRKVGGNAPLFAQLVGYLWKINDEAIIPASVIPSDKLVNQLLADYHQWVKEQSQR